MKKTITTSSNGQRYKATHGGRIISPTKSLLPDGETNARGTRILTAKELRARDQRHAESLALAIAAPVELALRINDSRNVTAVKDYAEASGIWCEMRDESGMGSSMMGRFTVVDLNTGKTVAHISYNGKVWAGTPEDWNPTNTTLLYRP